MTRRARWTLWGLLGLCAAIGALGLLLAVVLPSDAEVAQRIVAGAQAKLGVQVTLGAVRWQMFPPALVIEDAATVQPQPIRFRRLVAQPNIGELLRRRLSFGHVLVEDGVMPQLSLRGLHVVPGPAGTREQPVDQVRFRNLTWITRHGKELEFDGNLLFDAGWRPRSGTIVRPGVQPAAQLTLARESGNDRWQVQLDLGGGTANGLVEITAQADGTLQLAGRLEPHAIEVDSGLAAFKRHSVVHGKANGRTVLTAHGKTLGELARSLHTRTTFTIAPATLLHIDVDKAIRTVGLDRSGQTLLKSLGGQMDTQNTPDGMEVRYSAIEARGQTFSASGTASVANRQIEARVTVNPDGALPGIPLTVAGSLGAPKVTIAPVAVAKTAIGTVGAAIGKLFGAH